MSFAAVAVGGGAVLGAGASIYGAAKQAGAADDAAHLQTDASNRALALQKTQYDQSRADNEPWRQAGLTALTGMQDKDFQRDFTAADFTKDPGYDFRMQQGQQALERSAAARGGLQNGGMMKALSRYGQDYASNEYGNAYNRFNADRDRRFGRLSSIAGMGQNATAQDAAYGQNYANQAGNLMTGQANAEGAAKMGGAKAWANGVSGAANSITGAGKDWMSMSQMGGGGGGSGSGGATKTAGQSYMNVSGLA